MKYPNAHLFLGAHFDACALWRMYMPHLSMQGSGFALFPGQPDYVKCVNYDTVVVQRYCHAGNLTFLDFLHKLGLKLVYDLDDNVWEVPRSNPASHLLGVYKSGFVACMQAVDAISVST